MHAQCLRFWSDFVGTELRTGISALIDRITNLVAYSDSASKNRPMYTHSYECRHLLVGELENRQKISLSIKSLTSVVVRKLDLEKIDVYVSWT